jgi:hypothetical protein
MEMAASYTKPNPNPRLIGVESWFQYAGYQPDPDLPADGVSVTLYHVPESRATYICQEFIGNGVVFDEFDSYISW